MTELKGVHFGSYWMGDNDVVYLMSEDLRELCNLTIVDTCIYSDNKAGWYTKDYSYGAIQPVRWLDHQKVIELVNKEDPDFIIVNSGGMSLRPKTIELLRKKGIVTIGISLSDPDVYRDNGRVYSRYYDLFYTNSTYALNHLYKQENTKLLPFAASSKLHKPLEIDKPYDVVIVGHARPERIRCVKKIKKSFNVGLFGNGWGDSIRSVHGIEHVKAINSGKMYLSFSGTVAGYMNAKVGLFEAAACRTCVVTEIFAEMELYFKYGVEVLGYPNENQLLELIDTYSKDEKLRNWISNNCYRRFLNEHTWKHRWITVLKDITIFKDKTK
jgi:hypothetical protein